MISCFMLKVYCNSCVMVHFRFLSLSVFPTLFLCTPACHDLTYSIPVFEPRFSPCSSLLRLFCTFASCVSRSCLPGMLSCVCCLCAPVFLVLTLFGVYSQFVYFACGLRPFCCLPFVLDYWILDFSLGLGSARH